VILMPLVAIYLKSLKVVSNPNRGFVFKEFCRVLK
jgi:hypothetical protein